MTYTPTDEQIEKGAAAMYPRAFSRDAQWISPESREKALAEMRRQARAVLVAVGPSIAAQAWDEGVAARGYYDGYTHQPAELSARNPYREQEAR